MPSVEMKPDVNMKQETKQVPTRQSLRGNQDQIPYSMVGKAPMRIVLSLLKSSII